MKKIALTMLALLTMTVAVAQDKEKCQDKQKCECKCCAEKSACCSKEGKAPKEMTPETMTDCMAKCLSLTDAQKTKVLALNKEYKDVLAKGPRMGGPRHHKPQQVDGETGATQQQRLERPEKPQLTDEQKAQMKANMEKRGEYDKKLKEILTDEQYQKYEKMHKPHGRHGHHGPKGHGPRGPRPGGFPQE